MSEPTEQATPKRTREARARGEVATSRDAVSAAALVAACGALWATRTSVARAFGDALRAAGRAASEPGVPAVRVAVTQSASLALTSLAPPLVAGAAAAALVGALLTGFLIAPGAALPDLARLNPFASLKRYVRPRTYLEPVLHLARGALLLWLGYSAGTALLPLVLRTPRVSPLAVSALLGHVVFAVVGRMLAAAALLAGLDVLYRRWQHAQDQRMTREDVQREHKESDGDPHTRAARERLHKELLAEASLDRVRKASFIVTNPTHYAVALAWDEDTMEAPALLAKGEGEFARRIIAEAHRAGVPVLRDAPLARSLHEIDVGESISEALYEAVATVVNYLAAGGDPERFGE